VVDVNRPDDCSLSNATDYIDSQKIRSDLLTMFERIQVSSPVTIRNAPAPSALRQTLRLGRVSRYTGGKGPGDVYAAAEPYGIESYPKLADDDLTWNIMPSLHTASRVKFR